MINNLKKTIYVIFILLLISLFSSSSSAMDVTLQWDTNSDADYYVVYYGTSPGIYTHNSPDIYAPAIQHTIADLSETTWHFSVKAFNEFGNSSDFSEVVSSSPGGSPDLLVSIFTPATNTTITTGQSIDFQGNISGGQAPYTVLWTFGDGGPSDSSQEDPGSVVFPDEGSYNVIFTVTDSNNISSNSTVTVTVYTPVVDTEPLASILQPSANVTITEGSSVNFQGNVSEGNAPFTHSWVFGTGGPTDINVEDPGSISFPNAGTFDVTYTVRDSDNDISSSTITVTVYTPVVNTDPLASILLPSANVTITEGSSVNFQGNVSEGNAPFTHSWVFGVDGPTGINVEDPGSISFPNAGTFDVIYTVRDSDNDISNSTITVIVYAPVVDTNPLASILLPSTNITITEGSSVNFQGNVSEGNAPFTHSWFFGTGGPTGINAEDPGSISFPNAGTFNVTYTVRDSDGDTSSSNIVVTVNPSVVDSIPSASIISPASDVVIAPGGNVNFQGEVTGGNAPLVYSWTFGSGGPDNSLSEDPGAIVFTRAGVYTVTFIARDNDNDTNSSSVTVTVEEPVFEETPQPSPIYPDALSGVSLTPVLEVDLQDYEGKTRWQISFDENFSDLALDVKKNKGISTLKVPKMVLNKNTFYYWRVMQISTKSVASDWSNQTTFTTIDSDEDLIDEDENGVPDIQDIDSGVDLNNDGIADVDQDEIKAVYTLRGNTIVGIMKDQNVVDIEKMESIDHNTINDTVNRPDMMPSGLIGFKIVVAEPGDTASITVCFADAAPEGAVWYKYDSISGWQDYSAYTEFSSDRKQLFVEITDGGIGDADGAANGVIVDPAGLGIMADSSEPVNSIIDSGAGAGGGCFIGSVNSVPGSLPIGEIHIFFLSMIGCIITIRLFGARFTK